MFDDSFESSVFNDDDFDWPHDQERQKPGCYLLLKNIKVQKAAVRSSGFYVTPVHIGAALGLAQGMLSDLGVCKNSVGGRPKVLYVLHQCQYLMRPNETGYQQFKFTLPAGATPLVGSDYSNGRPTTQIQQESHVHLSLIIHFPDLAVTDIQRNQVLASLSQRRFAGGSLESIGQISLLSSINEAANQLSSGHLVIDRSALLQQSIFGLQTVHDRFYHALFARLPSVISSPHIASDQHLEKKAWILPFDAGYRLLERPVIRPGARDGVKHAYAENLSGLCELVTLRRFKTALQQEQVAEWPFWEIEPRIDDLNAILFIQNPITQHN